MPDTDKQAPVSSAPESAVATPPRHDPVPVVAAATPKPPVSKAETKPVSKPAATVTKTAKPKPVTPKPAAPEPAAAAPASVTTIKRKRGRPLGSKTLAKAPLMKAPVAKAVAPKTVTIAAKPVQTKPTKTSTKPVAPLVVAAFNEGPKTMTDTMAKIQDSAKKFTGEAGARTQAMFGDMSSRAKGAYEKSVKMTEELTEFQKGNVEAIVESSKLAAKAAETLGQNAADYARKSYETGTAAFKTFASAKSPTDLFKLQSDYLKSYFDSAVAESSKVTEAWLKLAGEVAQPLSNRVAVAVEKVKATAAI